MKVYSSICACDSKNKTSEMFKNMPSKLLFILTSRYSNGYDNQEAGGVLSFVDVKGNRYDWPMEHIR
jgi:hypothetical protein